MYDNVAGLLLAEEDNKENKYIVSSINITPLTIFMLQSINDYTPLSNPMRLWINKVWSSGISCRTSSRHSNSWTSSSQVVPAVKSKPFPCRIENLSTWRASISSGAMQLLRNVIVSLLDENTRSQGTADPWIGNMSMARAKSVGYRSWFSCESQVRKYK